VGEGAAWYAATRLDEAGTARVVDALLTEAGVAPVAEAPAGVEVVRRHGEDEGFLFVVNHTGEEVAVAAHGRELIGATAVDGEVRVPAYGVAVVREG
jgi:beta-galactosidase